MPHPADTPQAHATSAYLYPNSNRPNATQPQPRSSSLPFLMGSSQSKPPPAPSPTNVAAGSSSKAFTAAVAGGIKLKRAFAARRKKSEDVSSQLPPTHLSVQASDSTGKSTIRHPPSSSSLPRSTNPPPDSVTQVSAINKVPVPPSPSSPNQSSLSLQSNRGNTNMNRNSVIPLSPGISSAVNYMTLYDHTSPTSPVSSTSHAPSPHSSPEKEKDREADREKERENDSEKEKENQRQTKESWRKSDSTNSHHTIRPAARNSRPVSWAESFQSAYTVVPPPSTTSNQGGSSSSPCSRPRSALIGDSDFSMIELEEEEFEVDADDTVPLDRFFGNKPIPAVPPKAATSAPLASASATDHDAALANLDPPSTSAHPTHASLPPLPSPSLSGTGIGKGPLDHLTSHLSISQHSMQSTPGAVSANSNSNSSANVQGSAGGNNNMGSNFGISGINQSQCQTSNSNMSTNSGVPTSTSSSTAGPSSASSSSSVNVTSSLGGTGSSAVHLHNARVLPSLPSSSSSVSSPSTSGSVLSSGPSSYPHPHSFSHSHSYSSTPSSVQQQQQPHASGHNNLRTPLQPVRQQLSMPNPPSSSSSGTARPAGQERHYEYQYPLQLSPPPQSPHPHTQQHQQQPQQQPRAQTVSLSSPSPSSAGMGTGMSVGSTMQSAAAGLAKRAVEKMGMGRRWAMGLAGGHGGESDRERGGTGNGWTSSASASGAGGGGTSGYSSSSSGSMFEAGRSGSVGGSGAGRRPHSNSISHPITHPTPSGGGGGSTHTPKFLQNTSSKIIHIHGSRSKGGRHTGGTLGSVSSVRSDSHSSDVYYHGYGPSSSSPSPSPSPSPASFGGINSGPAAGVYQQPDGPHLGVKLRAGVSNVSGMGAMVGARPRGVMSGGLVFKRALSACVRDTSIWAGVSSIGGGDGGVKEKEGAKEGEEGSEGPSKEGGAKGRKGGAGSGRRGKGDLVTELETRKLPALVVRCAQHLLLWGIHEEGLFRVSGMPQHVTRLRAEFDSGADYDMTKCTLGDLDPHAVASVFKAYLRELPEPILTQKLQPCFDAAINKETSINTAATGGAVEPPTPTRMQGLVATASGGVHYHHPGLPSGPKSGFNFIAPPPSSSSSSSSSARAAAAALALRKAPSLSTLAMPSFTGIPPPSAALTASLRMLIDQLPDENKDLMRTVVDLIKATARESKETKMPLSNLMLVFCPSLNMTPPLLKVFCEAEGIWGEDIDEEEDDVHDVRRRTVVPNVPVLAPGDAVSGEDVPPPLPAKDGVKDNDHLDEDAKSTADTEEEGSVLSGRASLDTNMTDNNLSSDYHASAEEEDEEDGSSMFGGQDGPEVASNPSAIRSKRRRPHLDKETVPSSARDSEVPTVYLDSRSYCSTASSMSSLVRSEELQEDEHVEEGTEDVQSGGSQREGEGETTPGVNTFFRQQSLRDSGKDDALSVSSGGYSMNNMPISSPPPLSSSAESVATPTSSGNPSFAHLSSSMGDGNKMEKEMDEEQSSALHPHIVEANQLDLKPQQTRRDMVSAPIVASTNDPNNDPVTKSQPVHFPSSPPSPYHHFPYPEPTVSSNAPTKSKRRSIPILSLPSFSPSITPLLPSLSHTPPTSTPSGSPQSVGFPIGEQERERTLRTKKPSLKLLFSKRSASSLTSMRDSKGISFISNPVLQTPGQGHQGQGQSQVQRPLTPLSAASAMYNYRNSPKSASDSSVSTPLSAVTAPQSSLRSVSTNALPPVLDTPIEAGSLGLDYGLDPSPPTTAMLTAKTNVEGKTEERTVAAAKEGPQCGRSDLSQTVQKRAVVGRSSQQKSTMNPEQSTSPVAHGQVTANQLWPQASTSNLSIVSTTSSHHLSLFEDDDNEDVEDWTQSVLLAADTNWAVQNRSNRS